MKTILILLSGLFFCLPFVHTQTSFLDERSIPEANKTLSQATADGGWVVAYSYKTAAHEYIFNDIQLIKYDPCGEVSWTKKISTEVDFLNIVDILVTRDGEYYLIGYLIKEDYRQDIFLLKFNSDWTINFSKRYRTPLNDYPYSLSESPNGDLMVFGLYHVNNMDSRNFFLILDQEGNVKSSKTYFKGGGWGRGLACADGSYLGRVLKTIYKVGANGDLLWSNKYLGTFNSSEYVELEDGYVGISFRQELSYKLQFLYKLDKYTGEVIWTSKAFHAAGIPVLNATSEGNLLWLYSMDENENLDSNYLGLREFSSEGVELSDRILIKNHGMLSTNWIDFSVLEDETIAFSCFNGEDKERLFVGKTNTDYEVDCGVFTPVISDTNIVVTLQNVTTDIGEVNFEVSDLSIQLEDVTMNRERLCENLSLEFPLLPNDTNLCFGNKLRLDVSLIGANYLWQDGSTFSFFWVERPGNYSVRIEKCGQWVERSIEVRIDDCPCTIEAPNTFTPNGDGVNDVFLLVTDCDFSDFQLDIYNRWGKIVFQTKDVSASWDGKYQGKQAASELYVYKYRYKLNGHSDTEEKIGSGGLNLVR